MAKIKFWFTPLALLGCVYLGTLSLAAVPATINYQGYLKNGDGTPVTTASTIRFSLYSSNPARNNPVWRETQIITPSNGVYSVMLGSVVPVTVPFDVPYHLGVKVGSDSEMALQPLASVPYAQRAKVSEAVLAESIGTASIADNSVTEAKISNGAIVDAKISGVISAAKLDLSGKVSKSGDNMSGPLVLPANGLIIGSNQMVASSGRIGIGTATPANQLSVIDSTLGNDKPAVYGEHAVTDYFGIGVSGKGGYKGVQGTVTASGYQYYYGVTGEASTSISPAAGNAYGGHFLGSNALNNFGVTGIASTTKGTGTTYGGYFSATGGTENYAIYALGSNNYFEGNIGIGTTTPTDKLHVNGNIRLNNNNLFLRVNPDTNHGLGWFGTGKQFASTSPDGPVLFGYSGGALGSTNSTQKIALSWDNNSNITTPGTLAVGGSLNLTGNLNLASSMNLGGQLNLGTGANINLKDRDIYISNDTLHGLGWYGAGKTFNSINVDGPVLYGFSGGGLGTTNGGQKMALRWDNTSTINLFGNMWVNDHDIMFHTGDPAHGLGWYNSSMRPFKTTTFDDGPVLYGYASGGLGTTIGTGRVALHWDNSGNVQVSNNMLVTGTLSKGSGSFKIDHPLDPRNKYLYHSFVESPDMKNIYDGVVTTDADGYATVELPGWFEALNRDFRYQLTAIGQFAQVIVSKEIENSRFTIQSDKPSVKVSWQVTGIRKDPYAEANRIQVEVEKPEQDRGSCLHAEACNN